MGLVLTWLGHACWQITTSQTRLLIDPFLNDSPTASAKAAEVEADYILLTHGHFDHVADAEEIAKRTGATIISNFEIAEWFGRKGCEHVHGMNLGGGFNFPFGRVKSTIAWHSSTLPDGSSGGAPGGFLLTLPEGKVYIAGDTALFSDMKLIGDEGIDVAILPIGDNFTMGPEEAVRAVQWLRPRVALPSHYNTWPPIAQDGAAWAGRVRAETEAQGIALLPGESFSLGL